MNEARIRQCAFTVTCAMTIAILALVGLLSIPAPAPGQQYPVPSGLDHFKCYTATQRAFKQRTVKFKDQFESGATRVLGLRTLCNPVQKNDLKPVNKRAHLACYATRDVKPSFDGTEVKVTNQFGSALLSVTKPDGLCVPSLKRKGKAPPPKGSAERVLDHFRCYAVKPVKADEKVVLVDQFGKTETTVLQAVRLCNPVSKDGGRIRREKAHLVCYSIRDAQAFKTRAVRVRNQFGLSGSVRVTKPATLCLPSLKVQQT